MTVIMDRYIDRNNIFLKNHEYFKHVDCPRNEFFVNQVLVELPEGITVDECNLGTLEFYHNEKPCELIWSETIKKYRICGSTPFGLPFVYTIINEE